MSREIRKELGARKMSGRDLASKIGRSEHYVRARLNDQVEFNLGDVRDIAAVFGITTSELLRRAEG